MTSFGSYNVFTGSTTGVIKGVTVGKAGTDLKARSKICLRPSNGITNGAEITRLNWDNSEQSVLIGGKSSVRVYGCYSELCDELVLSAKDVVSGVCSYNGNVIFGVESGPIRTWSAPFEEKKTEELLVVGNSLCVLKQNPTNTNVMATGGKQNDLKLWDLNTKQCTFHAKNVKPDELQLEVPVWVSDACFLNNHNIAYCSRHGQIRFFDTSLPQRRPVICTSLAEQVFTCISKTPRDYQVLVGSGTGDLHLIDLRGKGLFVGKYKGFTGAVKDVKCTDRESLVVSVSLDRHFRIHDFTTRKLLIKDYFHSRLTSVLVRSDFELQDMNTKKKDTDSLEEEDDQNIEQSGNTKKKKIS